MTSIHNVLFASAATLMLAACGGGDAPDARQGGATGGTVTLVGAGATFPFPVYGRWFHEYQREHPVRVNYQSIGSGGGIRQFIEGTVDFGATDAPIGDEDAGRAPNGTLSLPTVIGAVVLTYNVPGLEGELRLDGPTIAGIFLGEIRQWNDPRIAALNPGVQLPARAVLPVHRSDGSGTTYVFVDYLSAVSSTFRDRVGVGTSVRWPTGIGAKGNEGVTGQVRQTPGAIGYVEQVYARQNDLPMASVGNRSGEFVHPSLEATRTAARVIREQVDPADPDFRISIVDSPAAGAYPISSMTYVLLPQHLEDCRKASALVEVWEWALREGDAMALELNYAPLPDELQELVVGQLGRVTCGADRAPAAGR
jgi:phosphate transport system substrate-binding protein